MKHFLVVFHRGYVWLDKPYSIDVNLISTITGLLRAGVDPTSLLKKDKDPTMITRIKNKYGMVRAKKGFLISPTNDPTVHFTTKTL